MRKAHFGTVFRKFVGHGPIGDAIGRRAPGANMQLIDAHRICHEALLLPSFHIVPVLPDVMSAVPNDGCGSGTVLGPGGKGVGFQKSSPVGAGDAILIMLSDGHVGAKCHPDTALHALHRLIPPGVEVAGETHSLCIRSPDHKTVFAEFRNPAAAVAEPGLSRVSGVIEPDVVSRDKRKMPFVHRLSPFRRGPKPQS